MWSCNTGCSLVILNYYEKDQSEISFITQVGKLTVMRKNDLYEMDFPAYSLHKIEVTDQMEEAYIDRDMLFVLPDAASVRNLQPNQNKLKELDGLLVVVTALSDEEDFDCISRIFAPKLDIPEDPVTGSTHCMITPYWSKRLSKNELSCFQASERSGILYTKICEERVKVAGKALLFSKGTILED